MRTRPLSDASSSDVLTPRPPRWRIAAVVIASFLVVGAIGLSAFRAIAGDLAGWPRMLALALLGYGSYLAAPLAVAAWLFGPRRMFAALGLTAAPGRALVFAFACSAIVLAWLLATATPNPLERLPLELMRSAILPGIAEELLFRAFLFGFLFRFAGWGFLPAALLSALVFGIEHLYQARDPLEALGVFLVTGLGGLWWSWLLVEWRWNVWVPIAFHVLLNGYFVMFDAADNAMGGAMFVLVRLACLLVSVAVTIVIARRRGGLRLPARRWLRGPDGAGSSVADAASA
jgi:membrane protease YdiL (CAAX protease family)